VMKLCIRLNSARFFISLSMLIEPGGVCAYIYPWRNPVLGDIEALGGLPKWRVPVGTPYGGGLFGNFSCESSSDNSGKSRVEIDLLRRDGSELAN
jgi:hypothetical protein